MRSHGIVTHVRAHALPEAEAAEREAREHQRKAAELFELAVILRRLHVDVSEPSVLRLDAHIPMQLAPAQEDATNSVKECA